MQEQLDCSNAIWDDDEWVSWTEINQQIQYKEWGAKYPNADKSMIPVFERLIELAEEYYFLTDKHLQVYSDIGELFGAITLGLKLHKNYAQGSDGRLGDDFVEVKTITPFKKSDVVEVKLSGNFSKVLIVKINGDFEISSRLLDRKTLLRGKPNDMKILRIKWSDITNYR